MIARLRLSIVFLTALLAFAPAVPAAAQGDLGILKPLGTMTQPSIPTELAALPDGTALFSADDGAHGRELWRTDGTVAGTRLVADITPGPESTYLYGIEVVKGLAYFWANGAVWRSDGTAAGTLQLKDFSANAKAPSAKAAAASATANEPARYLFQPLGDGVVVVNTITTDQKELWHVTPAGSRRLDVFENGPTQRTLYLSGVVGDKVLVTSDYCFCATDGTRAGTSPVSTGLPTERVIQAGDYVAFYGGSVDYGLSVLKPGETAATVVSPATWFSPTRAIDGAVYFGADDGLRRWTPAGVTTIGGPVPHISSVGSLEDIEQSGDSIFWPGIAPGDDYLRLARYDGHTAGVVPGHAYAPSRITSVGSGRVLFWGYDDREPTTGERVLWVADVNGMQRLVGEVVHGDYSYRMVSTRNGVVYPAFTRYGDLELHRSDGTAAGTGQLGDVNLLPKGSAPGGAVRVGSRVVFGTFEHQALWVTDGTAAGTSLVRSLDEAGDPLSPGWIDSDGTTAYFQGLNDGRVYQSDGTPAGTRVISPPLKASFAGLGRVGSAYVFGDHAWWSPVGGDLWRTDGTAAGTRPLGQTYSGSEPIVTANNGRTMLITAGSFSSIRTDGTSAAPLPTWRSHDAIDVPSGFLTNMYVGDYNTSAVGFELTHLDENGTNPRLVADLWPGKDSSVPRGLVRLGDRVVFVADTPAFGARWFSADSGGGDITPLPGLPATSLYPDFWQVGEELFTHRWEVKDDELTGISLYRADGTPGGSVRLRYFPIDDNTQLPADFTEFAGVTWFTAYDPEHGRELWRTDGTPEGTKLAADILPGEQSSDPMDLVAADDFLFFTAFDLEHGAEPWRIWSPRPPTPPGPAPSSPEVRIEPLPLPHAPRETLPVKKLQAIVSVKVKRLRTVGGRTRWRISGRVAGSGCSGRVRIDVHRGQRRLKSVTTSLKRCRYEAVVSTTTRGAGRSISVRTVATRSLVPGRSRTVRVR